MGTKRREREDEEPRRHFSSRSSYHGDYYDRHVSSRYEDRHHHSSSRHGDERHYGATSRHGHERHYGSSRHRSRDSSSRDEGQYSQRHRRESDDRRNREDDKRRAGDVEDGIRRQSSRIAGGDSRNAVDSSVKTDGREDLHSDQRVKQEANHEEPQREPVDIEVEQQKQHQIDEEAQEQNPEDQVQQQQQQNDEVTEQQISEDHLDEQPQQQQQSGEEILQQISADQIDVEMEQQEEQQQQVNVEETGTSGSKQDLDPEEGSQATGEAQPPTPEVQDVKVSPPSGACRIVDEYEKIGRLGEGAYGVVYKARDKRNGDVVAVKKIKMYNENTEGFPVTSLREINLLMSLSHPAIITVKEVVVNKEMDSVFMVMEYIETTLKDAMAKLKQPLDFGTVKWMLLQLLSAIGYLHDKWVLHRDVKPSNILLSREGELKLCDFGLARRAPELLSKGPVAYSTAIDIWSVGCIMGELLLNQPLFQGTSEVDQLKRICRVIPKVHNPGFLFQTQNRLRERILPPAAAAGRPMLSEKGFDLLSRMLAFDPNKRISAREAMNHVWFQEEPTPLRFTAAILDEDEKEDVNNVGGE